MLPLHPAATHVVSSKTFEVHISEDTVVPQLNFGLRASLPIGYLPTKLLSDRPPRAETLPLWEGSHGDLALVKNENRCAYHIRSMEQFLTGLALIPALMFTSVFHPFLIVRYHELISCVFLMSNVLIPYRVTILAWVCSFTSRFETRKRPKLLLEKVGRTF